MSVRPIYTESAGDHHNPHCLAIKLYDQRSTRQVYWSPQGNSYVVVKNHVGWWTAVDGTACDLYSINGHGECRWAVTAERGNTSGDTNAALYFGLTWHGWRGSK